MKIFQNEKETHNFLALLVVGTVLITLFTVMFNMYSIPPCLDNTVCMIDGQPHITIVTTDSIENKTVPPQSTSAYQVYAATHMWATTTPKTEWEKNMFPNYNYSNVRCYVANTSVEASVALGARKIVSFNYAFCPYHMPKFYAGAETGTMYSNMFSEGGVDAPIFKYWIMKKGENPESLISSIIKSLPAAEQRLYCKIESQSVTKSKSPKDGLKYYTIALDEKYLESLGYAKSSEGFDYMQHSSCYPYTNYFEVIDNVLIYVYGGQDGSIFDPSSLKFNDEVLPRIGP